VSLDDAYTLLTFARRSSVFAIRAGDSALVDAGLAACAAIGYERIDARDALVALALLHHAAERCSVEPRPIFEGALGLGEPAFARYVEDFLARPAADRGLRDAWGLTEAEGPHGVGLLGWAFAPWAPTVDLASVALRVAAALRGDDYLVDDPMLASTLPAVWLSATGDPELEPILSRVRAAATIHARPRSEVVAEPHQQQLTAWVVEASGAADARHLLELSRTPRAGDALLGLADGPLFALVVARSAVMGVPAIEDGERLRRFEPGLRAVFDA
jgi:hypothetical protein